MEGKLLNFIEVINELTFLACLYLCFLFTELSEDYDLQYRYGTVLIYLILSNIGVNVLFLLYKIMSGCILSIKKLIARCNQRK